MGLWRQKANSELPALRIVELEMPLTQSGEQEQAEFAMVAGRGQRSLSGMQSRVCNSDGISLCRLRWADVRDVRRDYDRSRNLLLELRDRRKRELKWLHEQSGKEI